MLVWQRQCAELRILSVDTCIFAGELSGRRDRLLKRTTFGPPGDSNYANFVHAARLSANDYPARSPALLRFTLGLRGVKEISVQRGIQGSYEAIELSA